MMILKPARFLDRDDLPGIEMPGFAMGVVKQDFRDCYRNNIKHFWTQGLSDALWQGANLLEGEKYSWDALAGLLEQIEYGQYVLICRWPELPKHPALKPVGDGSEKRWALAPDLPRVLERRIRQFLKESPSSGWLEEKPRDYELKSSGMWGGGSSQSAGSEPIILGSFQTARGGGSSGIEPPEGKKSPPEVSDKALEGAKGGRPIPDVISVGGMPVSLKELLASAGTGDVTVAAGGRIGEKTFTDLNQTARPANRADENKPTLIAERIATKEKKAAEKAAEKAAKAGVPCPDAKPLPNGNMATAHAEIGVIQQAYDTGITDGATMSMTVVGKDVCDYCKGDVAAAAEVAGLKSLTIEAVDDKTGLPKTYYWKPEMKSLKEEQKS